MATLTWRGQARAGGREAVHDVLKCVLEGTLREPTVLVMGSEGVGAQEQLHRVRVRAAGRLVADHPRAWARGMTITDPVHVERAARLRQQFQQPRPVRVADDLARDLGDYDRAFGLTGEVS